VPTRLSEICTSDGAARHAIGLYMQTAGLKSVSPIVGPEEQPTASAA